MEKDERKETDVLVIQFHPFFHKLPVLFQLSPHLPGPPVILKQTADLISFVNSSIWTSDKTQCVLRI